MSGHPATVDGLWVIRQYDGDDWAATWSRATAEGARAADWQVIDVNALLAVRDAAAEVSRIEATGVLPDFQPLADALRDAT